MKSLNGNNGLKIINMKKITSTLLVILFALTLNANNHKSVTEVNDTVTFLIPKNLKNDDVIKYIQNWLYDNFGSETENALYKSTMQYISYSKHSKTIRLKCNIKINIKIKFVETNNKYTSFIMNIKAKMKIKNKIKIKFKNDWENFKI